MQRLGTEPQADVARSQVQHLEAENDALRADIDRLLAQLDATDRTLASIRALQHQTETERDLAQWDARITSAGTQSAEYVRRHDQYFRDFQTSTLREDSIQMHRLALELEAARLQLARQLIWSEAELEATQGTLSWRITRPLRATRRGLNRALVWLSGGRWSFSAARRIAEPAHVAIPLAPQLLSEVPLLDLTHYRRCYPSLDLLSDADLLTHYVKFGRQEQRSAISHLQRSRVVRSLESQSDASSRETILLVLMGELSAALATDAVSYIHELSWKYHVVTVSGPLADLSRASTARRLTSIIVDADQTLHDDDLRALAAELMESERPSRVVIVADDSGVLGTAFVTSQIPVFSLQDARSNGLAVTGAEQSLSPSQSASLPTFTPHRFSYAAHPDLLAQRRWQARAQHDLDREIILRDGGLDARYFTDGALGDIREIASAYLRDSRISSPQGAANELITLMRPRPGFHPLAYAESAPGFIDDGRDPLAHFIAAGQPAGRWSKRLITPFGSAAGQPSNSSSPTVRVPATHLTPQLRVLIHGHFYYPELVTEFLDLLARNSADHTLALTTDTHAKARQLAELARMHPAGRHAQVRVVTNRGRNISALFSGSIATIAQDHDLVLHIHGKRSPQAVEQFGETWRRHLWTHLVGDGFAFADQIIEEFARSPQLGLVAAEDRRLHDWDGNRAFADPLIKRLTPQLTNPATLDIPTHFDFPIGAMFWARTSALAPFLHSELGDEDFPAEPLPVDGTALHAMERLIPLVIEHEGFEFAKTHLDA